MWYLYNLAPAPAPGPGPQRRSGCFPAEPYPPPRQIECIRKESRPQESSWRLGVEDFKRTCKAQALAGPAIQGVNDGAQLVGGNLGQICALGQVLTQEAVGVLVGLSLATSHKKKRAASQTLRPEVVTIARGVGQIVRRLRSHVTTPVPNPLSSIAPGTGACVDTVSGTRTW